MPDRTSPNQTGSLTTISHARRVAENALLSAQWRIEHQVTGVSSTNVVAGVEAAVALHNLQWWNSTPEAPISHKEEKISSLQPLRRVGANYIATTSQPLERGPASTLQPAEPTYHLCNPQSCSFSSSK